MPATAIDPALDPLDDGGDEEMVGGLPLEPVQLGAIGGLPSLDERLSFDGLVAAALEEEGWDDEGEEGEGEGQAGSEQEEVEVEELDLVEQAGPEGEEGDDDDFSLDDLMDVIEAFEAEAGVKRGAAAPRIQEVFSDPKWHQPVFPGANVSLLVHCYAKLREKSAGHIRNGVFDRMLQYDSKVTACLSHVLPLDLDILTHI